MAAVEQSERERERLEEGLLWLEIMRCDFSLACLGSAERLSTLAFASEGCWMAIRKER